MTDMKIYCLSAFTQVTDYCGFGGDRIVSLESAVNDYVSFIKDRILKILSKKPYLHDNPVFISVKSLESDSNGIFRVVHSYTISLRLDSNNNFSQFIK